MELITNSNLHTQVHHVCTKIFGVIVEFEILQNSAHFNHTIIIVKLENTKITVVSRDLRSTLYGYDTPL